ncbi:MAG: dipeptide/oligopeptide/nickel ABC transporter permease/ATP-binding protein [Dysosmobacter welbionis]
MTRTAFAALRDVNYVKSARLMGASSGRILVRQILPNTTQVLLPAITIGFNNAVLAEASMSYLGIGVTPPDASLGYMLSEAQGMLTSAPWYALGSGGAIVLLIFGVGLIGEGLQRRNGGVLMLEIRDLHVKFHTRQREAVAGVSLTIHDGEILGLVGESGSGKSVTAMSVAGLLPRKQCDFSGEILLDGAELLHADRTLLRQVQGREIGVVFQEPQSCMDPLMRIGPQVEEVLRIHTDLSREARRDQALAALAAVELPDPAGVYRKYPHELSGGMLQRAMIAAAAVARPKLLLLDEPTTALDVTIQAQILELLKKLNRESGISMLFISHNLNVVRKLCTRTAVMQRGVLVEEGDIETVFRHPRHPYTQRLIAAIPTRHRKEETP